MKRCVTGLVVAGAVMSGVLAGSAGTAAADTGSSSLAGNTGSAMLDIGSSLAGSSEWPWSGCAAKVGAPCGPTEGPIDKLLNPIFYLLMAVIGGPTGSGERVE